MTVTLLDDVLRAFLAVLQASGQTLARYSLLLLGVLAVISFYREYGTLVMQGGAGLGEALGQLLLFAVAGGGYYWLLVNLVPLAQAALGTMVQWALEASGQGFNPALLTTPSLLLEIGLQAAWPAHEADGWFTAMWNAVKMVNKPGDALAKWCVVVAFLGITLHHMMMLIEFWLAVALGAVLIPWGIWRLTAGVAEFALGWLTGACIRALVSLAMVGISTPLFGRLLQPAEGFFTYYQTAMLIAGSFMFMVLCWVIPARAAHLAGRASLGLTGSTVASSAMTLARFGAMAMGLARAGAGAIRGSSQLLGRTP